MTTITTADKSTSPVAAVETPSVGQSSPSAAEAAPNVPSETTPPAPAADAPPERSVVRSWLWLRDHDQTFVAVCVAVFLVIVGANWAKLSGWGAVPLEVDRLPARRLDFRIDINKASWVEWSQIEEIGEATARKIIEDREANGPFRNVSDLLRVKGIGPKTLERMRPFLKDDEEIK
jgi:competence protein ComEA